MRLRAREAAQYLRAQFQFGKTLMYVLPTIASFAYYQSPGPETRVLDAIWILLGAGALFFFLAVQQSRPRLVGKVWCTMTILMGCVFLGVTVLVTDEKLAAFLTKLSTDEQHFFNNVGVIIWFAIVYSQPLSLRTRYMTITVHLALRTLQGAVIYARVGPEWFVLWVRVSWVWTVSAALGGWGVAAAVRRSGALACVELADGLEAQYGDQPAGDNIPNSMLKKMVENLKAEAYRLRLMRIGRRSESEEAEVEAALNTIH